MGPMDSKILRSKQFMNDILRIEFTSRVEYKFLSGSKKLLVERRERIFLKKNYK